MESFEKFLEIVEDHSPTLLVMFALLFVGACSVQDCARGVL